MKITRLAAATAIATIMAAGTASALSLTYVDAWVGSYETVDYVETSLPKSGNNQSAGAFKMTDTNAGLGSMGTFAAWCLDLAAQISPGTWNYVRTTSPFSNSHGLSTASKAGLQKLFDSSLGGALVSATTSAAFQVAAWELVYDDPLSATSSVSTGNFKASDNANVVSLANTYLSAAFGWTGGKVYDLTFLESTDVPRKQNLVTAELAPVPLPAAGLLLLGALGGLAGLRRRRKAA